MLWGHSRSEVASGAGDDGRDTVAAALHQRGDFLRSGDKEKAARKLRSKGWSYRRIAEALEVPYRRISQWLGGGSEPAPGLAVRPDLDLTTLLRPLPPLVPRPPVEPAAAPRRAPEIAPLPEPPAEPPAPAIAPAAPAAPPAAGDPAVLALVERTEMLCRRVDTLVGAMEAERAAIAEERREQRQRDQKLIELLTALALAIKDPGR